MISNALVFSSSQIQFLQTDLKQKKILYFNSTNLPPGLIQRGVITDNSVMLGIIGNLLNKAVYQVKKAVLIIPEDTVVSKSLQLPNLAKGEVDEAVRWEAENYLPFELNKAVLDWEILSQNGKLHVLFEAAASDMIDGYLKIFEQLKIEIIAIETPALAMVRLAENKKGIRILIYIDTSEVILALSKDDEVVATSIIANNQRLPDKLLQTVTHMANFYQDFPVQWLQIGGSGVNNQIIKQLASLKLPINGFVVPFQAQPELANQYILAISAVLKPITPPDDEKSINLLPDWYVSQYYRKSFVGFLKKILIVSLFFSLLLLVALGSVFFWLTSQENSLKQKLNAPPSITREAIAQASKSNNLARLAQTLTVSDYFPIKTASNIKSLTGDKIKLANLHLTLVEKKGELTGLAADRVSLLSFKQAVEDLKEIKLVYLPISSFTQEENLPFELRFSLEADIANYEKNISK